VGRHPTGRGIGVAGVVVIVALAVAGAAAITGALAVAGWLPGGHGTGEQTAAVPCDGAVRDVRVVTASSFAPVLNRLGDDLAQGGQCLRLRVEQADGRTAATQVAVDDADVWIPDDASWKHVAPPGLLGPDRSHEAGAVLATSPFFMVTDSATGRRLTRAGGSWLALADLVANSGVHLVVRDPAGSGDGLVGAGYVAEAVWVAQGMDASALALEKIVEKVRVDEDGPAMPTSANEVGVVPEYALLPALARPGGAAPMIFAGRDHTAQLRYTWFPTAKAVADPVRAAALDRLRAALTGPRAAQALDAAGLRSPESKDPPTRGRQAVPALTAATLPVLGGHHVDHVFASWYRDDRQMNVTMVVDVSWSMSSPAPGGRTPLIDLVGHGAQSVGDMLPDQARLGLWTFGSQLDGTRDYRIAVPIEPLTREHRAELASVVGRLHAEHTGTGLYDTILAAYTAARDAYTPGRSNQVMVFTDGINEDDPDSISLPQLTRRLLTAQDPRRPVQLSLVAFGEHPQVAEISKALDPVHAYVEPLRTATQVEAMFIHLASGGLHSESRS